MGVDLVMPVKELRRGKSRLRGAVALDAATHTDLVRALALDTIDAAARADSVRRILVVTVDPALSRELRGWRVETVPDASDAGLNAALRQGYALLRGDDPDVVIGALQSDLPALRPAELTAALAGAGGARSFCADAQGTGTTLLLSAAGGTLDPRFGQGSAGEHARSGAKALPTYAPSLRRDVDTPHDLVAAARLGLGPRTAAVLDVDGHREFTHL